MIQQKPNGTYVWQYRMSMFRNPTILITFAKFMSLTLFICWFMLSLIAVFTEGWKGVWGITQLTGIGAAIFAGLTLIAYPLLALFYGGSYDVEFTLSEKELVHRQTKKQFRQAQKLGCALAVVSIFARRPAGVGQSMMVAAHNKSTTTLKNVTEIRGKRRRGVIYVNQRFNHNEVYVAPEDYNFVFNFLCAHCPKAKVKA